MSTPTRPATYNYGHGRDRGRRYVNAARCAPARSQLARRLGGAKWVAGHGAPVRCTDSPCTWTCARGRCMCPMFLGVFLVSATGWVFWPSDCELFSNELIFSNRFGWMESLHWKVIRLESLDAQGRCCSRQWKIHCPATVIAPPSSPPWGCGGCGGKGRLPLTLTQIAEGQVQSSTDCVIRMNQIS